MDQHRLLVAAQSMQETPPSVFMQLRLLASKVDKSVKEAKLALDHSGGDMYHHSGGNAYAFGFGMTLVRQKQDEVAALKAAMIEFLATLRGANDGVETSLSACEASVRDKAACMDRIEVHFQKYGYQPYDESTVPQQQQGISRVASSIAEAEADEEEEEETGSSCMGAAARATEPPRSACKTPSRSACRGPLITPGASTAKENVIRTPKLKDFASKETLSLIANVNKQESAAKRFVPRSLPFESMGNDLSNHSTDSSILTRSSNDVKPASTIRHGTSGVLAAPNFESWREAAAEVAASPDDLSGSVRPLVTPLRPSCVQQLFLTTAAGATGAAVSKPADLPVVAVAGGCIQASALSTVAGASDGCRIAPMDDGEYSQLESYLRRYVSKEEINSAIHVLSKYFSDPLADRSRDRIATVLEDHLGRKSKSVFFLLIKTQRLESHGAAVVPVDAAATRQ